MASKKVDQISNLVPEHEVSEKYDSPPSNTCVVSLAHSKTIKFLLSVSQVDVVCLRDCVRRSPARSGGSGPL